MNQIRLLEALFGEQIYRMAGGGWGVHCMCCQQPYTLPEEALFMAQRCSRSYEVLEVLRAEPLAICGSCRVLYGTANGYLQAQEVAARETALVDRDGISPMVGAE